MVAKQYHVNDRGLAKISEFLKELHKRGELISQSPSMLSAWASDAEFQLSEGNPATIEIRSFASISGRTEELYLDEDCVDSEEIATEE